MNDDWKIHFHNYLTKKYGDDIKEPIHIDLGEVDFYIPPLLGIDADSMKAIQKHNQKINIFS